MTDVNLLRHFEGVRLSLLAFDRLFRDETVGGLDRTASDDVDLHKSPHKLKRKRATSVASDRLRDPLRPRFVTISIDKPTAETVPVWRSDEQQGLHPVFWFDTIDMQAYGQVDRVVLAIHDVLNRECIVEYDLDLDALSLDQPTSSDAAVSFLSRTGQSWSMPLQSLDGADANADSSDMDQGSGYASDPGSGSTRRPKLRHARSSAFTSSASANTNRTSLALAMSKTETRMTKPASTDKVVQLVQSENVLNETRHDLAKIQQRVERLLDDLQIERELVERRDKLQDLAAVKDVLEDEIQDCALLLFPAFKEMDVDTQVIVRAVLENKRQVLDRRKARLASAKDKLVDLEQAQRSAHRTNVESQKMLAAVRYDLLTARRVALTHLSFIYPIEPTETPLLFTINGLDLPNSTFPPPGSKSDSYYVTSADKLATALGYVSALTLLLSSYLSVPLPYTILFCSSKTVVQDDISADIKGTRSFPLWERGTEKWRMEYAWFLLNKDVEAVVSLSSSASNSSHLASVPIVDLRTTLPNVKSLMLAYELDPAHASFPASLSPHNALPSSSAVGSGQEDPTAGDDESPEASQTKAISANRERASSNASTIKATTASGASRSRSGTLLPGDRADGNDDIHQPNDNNDDEQFITKDGVGVANGHSTTVVKSAPKNEKRKDSSIMEIWAGRSTTKRIS